MRHSKASWWLVVFLVLLWVLAIYPAYYVVHKPLSPATFRAITNVIADLLTWVAMLAVAAALGSRLTRRMAYASLLERLTFSTGLGLGVFSVLTLILGLVGLLYRWLFWVLLLVGGLLLWKEFRNLGTALWTSAKQWKPRWTVWPAFLSLFLLVTLLLALVLALLPPTEWDGLTYHLVGPDQYLHAHRLAVNFDIYYLFFPSFVEMLFTAGMALRGDILPHLIHFSYLLLTLGALGAFAGRYWKRSLGLVAAALFASIPTAIQIAAWSYVDLALTFYNFAAVYALLNWLGAPNPNDQVPAEGAESSGRSSASGWLVLAGLFSGAALSIKYTGGVTLLVLGAILIWELVRRRLNLRLALIGGLTLAGVALAVAAPWYVKNVLVTGNPVYPLVFGGREWNEVSTRWLLVLGEGKTIWDLLLVPWTLTVIGKEGTLAYDATYSPLFLTLLPLLLVVPRKVRGWSQLLLAAGVGYGFWIASGVASYGTLVLQGRQVLPIFAPLSLLCAYALDGMRIWDRKSFSLQRFLMMLVGLTLGLGLIGQVLLAIGFSPWPYLAGLQSRSGYQDQFISQDWHEAITYINDNLGPEDSVLFVWEPRSYGTRVPHEPDVLFDNISQLIHRYGSAEAVLEGLKEEGVTHLLVNQFIYPWIVSDYPLTANERTVWEDFADRYLTDSSVVYSDGTYLVLYRLPR